MGLAFRQIKVYSKLAVVALVAAFVVVVAVMNQGNTADVWLLKKYEQVPTLWLIFFTSAVAVVTGWAAWGTRRLLREWRQVRREAGAEAKLAEQKRLADELTAQERRINEKLTESISDDD